MKLCGALFHWKYFTSSGNWYFRTTATIDLCFLSIGRWFLRRGVGRCTWCGLVCGFQSSVSRKGLRCRPLLERTCEDML